MKALPPLKRNASLDKPKLIDKIGSSLSPLSSPKPKPSSMTKQDNVVRSGINKKLVEGASTDTEDHKSSSMAESRFNENPRTIQKFI